MFKSTLDEGVFSALKAEMGELNARLEIVRRQVHDLMEEEEELTEKRTAIEILLDMR